MPTYNLDANHTEIADAFRQLGCRVMDLAKAKHYTAGTLDLVVGIPSIYGQGTNVVVEVKTEDGRLSESQREVVDDWREAGLPVEVVRNLDDVAELVARYRVMSYNTVVPA